ncbi:MAG: ABC transporter permease [Hyphomicrobiales bacterium]
MARYILARLLSAAAVLALVCVVSFMLSVLASDTAISMAGNSATAGDIAAVRSAYGLDKPGYLRFLGWLADILRGDLGRSLQYRQPVAEMIAGRLGVTLTLGLVSLTFALCLALPLGIAAAVYRNTVVDRAAVLVGVMGQAMPTPVFALGLMIVFGLKLGWLPVSGTENWRNYVLPAIVLGYVATPSLLRLTRAGMIEALASDYVRTARAYGLGTWSILVRHALRNALAPLLSLCAVSFGHMLAGSIVVEQAFALRGIGWLTYDATVRADLPVLQAAILVVATFYVALTLAADLCNAWLDPKVRLA